MKRWLGWIAIGWLLAICGVALAAYGNPRHVASLSERTRTVALQLRCPVCQGESVADSPSDIASAMRTIIKKRLAAGQSPDQIKAYFVSKYGNWILLAPPTAGIGNVAWLAPPLLLLGSLGLLFTLVVSWRTSGRQTVTAGREEYLRRVRLELADENRSE